jgi:hypothetical protein
MKHARALATRLLTPVLLAACAATAAAAQETAAGHWLVSGRVSGKDFTLDCRFQQAGQSLSGACVDGDTHDARVKGGRSHTLTRSHVGGGQVTWTYQSSFGLIHFDANYAGVLKGDHISGQISALGQSGPFTAVRSGS